MKATVKMFLSALAIVALTIITYYMIASLAGGINEMLEKSFGGAKSAFTILGLLTVLFLVWAWENWLQQRRDKAEASALLATVGPALVLVAGLAGWRWVLWSWEVLWIIPLLAPAVLAAVLLATTARRIFEDESPTTTPEKESQLDSLLEE
ncbi:MAG: hypothetical protein EOM03_16030 [Clostridia bacterium]|nr:hypothetical protein [Clostridia bacterium]